MTQADLDVMCIGNAIVDVLAHCEDETILGLGLNRGTMTLIGADRAQQLYNSMGAVTEMSGGSASNTAAGIASLGGQAGFVGKVRDDQLGKIFVHDIHTTGVVFETPPATSGPATARCLIFITSDAQRTMNTYLGACVNLRPEDIAPDFIGRAKIVYMEGYLWDRDQAKQAFLKAAEVAQNAGRKVSLTLSDQFCVDRHRISFINFIRGYVDILFSNEEEIISLYQVEDFNAALRYVRDDCEVAVLTRSGKGSVIVSGGEKHVIYAEPVAEVVDTTGAGDLYAAGFLYGITNGHRLVECGRIASIVAAEVISHVGPRPQKDLKELVRTKLGI